MNLSDALRILRVASGAIEAEQRPAPAEVERAAAFVLEALRAMSHREVFAESERDDICQTVLVTLLEHQALPETIVQSNAAARAYLRRMLRNLSITSGKKQERLVYEREDEDSSLPQNPKELEPSAYREVLTSEEEVSLRQVAAARWKVFEAFCDFATARRRSDARATFAHNIQQMIALAMDETSIAALAEAEQVSPAALHTQHRRARQQLLRDLPHFREKHCAENTTNAAVDELDFLEQMCNWLRQRGRSS